LNKQKRKIDYEIKRIANTEISKLGLAYVCDFSKTCHACEGKPW